MGNEVSQQAESNTKRRPRRPNRVVKEVVYKTQAVNPCAMCGEHLHRGLRQEAIKGWKEGTLCVNCVFSQERRLSSGDSAYTIAMRDDEVADEWNEEEKSLVTYLRYVRDVYYEKCRNEEVSFGKYRGCTYQEVCEDYYGYIRWCRDTDNPTTGMQLLLDYADIHSRFRQ